MPSVGRSGHGDTEIVRADVVPGTQGHSTANGALIDRVERHAVAAGLTVRHDEPYRGGFTTRHWGRPAQRVHAIQVELARRLYMNEATLRKTAAFGQMQAFCGTLVRELGQAARTLAAASP
jgi:N-formylglutamate deformylase